MCLVRSLMGSLEGEGRAERLLSLNILIDYRHSHCSVLGILDSFGSLFDVHNNILVFFINLNEDTRSSLEKYFSL